MGCVFLWDVFLPPFSTATAPSHTRDLSQSLSMSKSWKNLKDPGQRAFFFHQVKPTENWVGLSWTKQSIVLSTNGSPNISAKICWNTFVGARAVFFVIVADPQCYNMLPQQCIWPHQYLSDHRTWGMVLSENVVLHPPISTGLVASVSHLRPKGGYFDVSQNVIKCYTLW